MPSVISTPNECQDPRIRIIGFFDCGFVLFRERDLEAVYIMDQHAAHERVRLELLQYFGREDALVRKEEPLEEQWDGLYAIANFKMQACKGAITISDQISLQEGMALIRSLFGCRLFRICAHGRPTMVKLLL